jgi:integrase
MGLFWTDIDLDRRIIVFRGELGKSPSEKRGRVIPLSPHLIEEL